MFKWSVIIEQNKEKLIEALEKEFKTAVKYRHLQCVTEIYKSGKIRTWECAAGSSSYSYDSWKGESLVVGTFCFQNLNIEVTEEDFRRHMTEEEQNNAGWMAKEDNLSFLNYIYSSGNYTELIEEVEQEWTEWYIDEYAYSTACETVEYKLLDELRSEEV